MNGHAQVRYRAELHELILESMHGIGAERLLRQQQWPVRALGLERIVGESADQRSLH